MSNVIDFHDAQARRLGYESYDALADDVVELIDAQLQSDPEFLAWLKAQTESHVTPSE